MKKVILNNVEGSGMCQEILRQAQNDKQKVLYVFLPTQLIR